jgi:hypothetical protein
VTREVTHMESTIRTMTGLQDRDESARKVVRVSLTDKAVLDSVQTSAHITNIHGNDRKITGHCLFNVVGEPSESLVHKRQSAALR